MIGLYLFFVVTVIFASPIRYPNKLCACPRGTECWGEPEGEERCLPIGGQTTTMERDERIYDSPVTNNPENESTTVTLVIEIILYASGGGTATIKAVEPDPRVHSIMNAIGSCLEETSHKAARISVLKVVTGIFTEKEITRMTGASRYLVRQAKEYGYDELRRVTSFIRERYDKEKVELFLRFLARPEILIALPNACKLLTLDNGAELPIASMARLYSYREIFSLFGRHCEEVGRSQGLVTSSDISEFVRSQCLGYSTAYKLMEVIAPVRKIRMACVDSYQASAMEAFDSLSMIVQEMSLSGHFTPQDTTDLNRRIRVTRSFMFGEMRLHISRHSNVLSHCWTHALTDSNDARFAAPCLHDHDSYCTECAESILLPDILNKMVRGPFHDAEKSKDATRHRLKRITEILEECDSLIRSFRHHVMRCVASEYDRREIIDGLEDGYALIVADFAMKILPTDAVEKQSNWFAKSGISYHMTAVTARLNGELFTHSFGHLSAVSKQDSTAVAGILEHALKQLIQNGITHVHLRTDNAGTYHCIGLIATLSEIMNRLGIVIISHIFSEPQYGKGTADRQISISKGKLSSFIDSGKPACTPSEMFDGFVSNILLKGFSFYIIEVTEEESSCAVLRGVKQFGSFRFQKGEGVRVRRHDAIGEGMLVKNDELPPISYKVSIQRKGGYLSGTEHFWKSVKNRNEEGCSEIVQRDDSLETTVERPDNIKLCPDELCQARFTTDHGLEEHRRVGKHSYYKINQTVTDYASEKFSELVETTEAAQILLHQDSIVPLAISDRSEERAKGWALRKTDRNGALDPNVKMEVERMVREDLEANRRAEAREIRDKLRGLKCDDQSYRFPLKKCLNEGQIKSQITRILNIRKKELESQGGKEPGKSDELKNDSQAKRGRGRKRKYEEMASKNEDQMGTEDHLQEDCLGMIQEEIEKEFDKIFEKK